MTVHHAAPRVFVLCLGLGAFVAGCSSGADDFECIAGVEGCVCLDDIRCVDGSDCVDGRCRSVRCPRGEPGCACALDLTCGDDVDGAPLRCIAGRCEPAACPAGERGCECVGAGRCRDDLICSDASGMRRCESPTCPPGDEGCTCFVDRTCGSSASGATLTCVDRTCTPVACMPGALDCACRPDYGCEAGAHCVADRCVSLACPPGAPGCVCGGGGTCDGEALCVEGICEAAGCPNGSAGCACLADGGCAQPEFTCEAGRCLPRSCTVGSAGCACFADTSCAVGATCADGWCLADGCVAGGLGCDCDDAACEDGLICVDGVVCVSAEGHPGGPCLADRTCEGAARCDGAACVACNRGEVGCGCRPDGACDAAAACFEGRCVDAAVLDRVPPGESPCFTPCTGDMTRPDGSVVLCDGDGLLQGCLPGLACVEGSCVAFDAGPEAFLMQTGIRAPRCAMDADCPDFQRCMQARCHAECSSGVDCDDSEICHRRVCRRPCVAPGEACAPGEVCLPVEGATGVCIVDAPAAAAARSEFVAQPEFGVQPATLSFSDLSTDGVLRIFNAGRSTSTFFVTKQMHVESPSGARRTAVIAGRACQGAECPLSWLDIEIESVDGTVALDAGATQMAMVPGGCDAEWVPCQTDAACPGGSGDVCGDDGYCVCGDDAPAGCRDPSRCVAEVRIAGADAFPDPTTQGWIGELVVRPVGGAAQSVPLEFRGGIEGRWVGEVSTFADFEDAGLDDWIAGGRDPSPAAIAGVQNALLTRWAALRRGALDIDGFREVLIATESESWRFPSVQARCPDAACYLTTAGEGIAVYSTSSVTQPVPSGRIALPFGMTLTPTPDGLGLTGRIDSDLTLHVPGDPAVSLRFADDPAACDPAFPGDVCAARLTGFEAEITIGGRYVSDRTDTICSDRSIYRRLEMPWLVEGIPPFGAPLGEGSTFECRDDRAPRVGDDAAQLRNALDVGGNPVPDGRALRRRLEFIDGILLDGETLFVLFREVVDMGDEQTRGYGYLRLRRAETTLAATDTDADGLPDVFQGNPPLPTEDEPDDILGPGCDPDLVREAIGIACPPGNDCLPAADDDLERLARALIDGAAPRDPVLIDPNVERVHALCVDTGLFDPMSDAAPVVVVPDGLPCRCPDGNCRLCPANLPEEGVDLFDPAAGAGATFAGLAAGDFDVIPTTHCVHLANDGTCDDGGTGAASALCALGTDPMDCPDREPVRACPVDSDVVFFTVDARQLTAADITDDPCHDSAFGGRGTCDERLEELDRMGLVVQRDPLWRCRSVPGGARPMRCDADRMDLTAGRDFLAAEDDRPPALPALTAAIDQGFRYKTRFVGRDGDQVGFVPGICGPDDRVTPYCYDPALITATEQRIDCLHTILAERGARLTASTRAEVTALLTEALSETPDPDGRAATVAEGFERLSAELLILLGDDAMTQAFAARFDQAQVNRARFPGSLFEGADGLDLGGVAGFEMVTLHRAVQAYGRVLDRFFHLLPTLRDALDGPPPRLVTQATVTTWLERVVVASTRRAMASSEIARRYRAFERSDLAERVLRRAYVAAFVEGQIFADLLFEITAALSPSERPQVAAAMADAQRAYDVALREMRDVFDGLDGGLNALGFAPDFIPFPALDDPAIENIPLNAFETLLPEARRRVQLAADREERALADGRDFDTDAAAFQAELAGLQRGFDDQLAAICGTFTVEVDGAEQVLPAVPAFADLEPALAAVGDPCGLAEGGSLRAASQRLDQARVAVQRARVALENTLETIEQLMGSLERECQLIIGTAELQYEARGQVNSLRAGLRVSQAITETIMQVEAALQRGFAFAACAPVTGQCAVGAAVAVGSSAAAKVSQAAQAVQRVIAFGLETQIDVVEQREALLVGIGDCQIAEVHYRDRIFAQAQMMEVLQLDVRDRVIALERAAGEIQTLRNQATRLMAQRTGSLQRAIDVAAARNDPNVRIFRNDAFFNADRAFFDALRLLYVLTVVYEYHTSTSFDAAGDLFLVRLARRGQLNLENYLLDLENAFRTFENDFGNPDVRVLSLSARDDMLDRATLIDGAATTRSRQVADFRAALADPARRDAQGDIVIEFTTVDPPVSPLTANHKILFVEAELQGAPSGLGDDLARVYLRARGTGAVESLDPAGEPRLFSLPERTAVIDAMVAGRRPFEDRVYRSYRLRDRPLVTTTWELVLPIGSEAVDDDIDLGALSDVVLHIHYTDFTP